MVEPESGILVGCFRPRCQNFGMNHQERLFQKYLHEKIRLPLSISSPIDGGSKLAESYIFKTLGPNIWSPWTLFQPDGRRLLKESELPTVRQDLLKLKNIFQREELSPTDEEFWEKDLSFKSELTRMISTEKFFPLFQKFSDLPELRPQDNLMEKLITLPEGFAEKHNCNLLQASVKILSEMMDAEKSIASLDFKPCTDIFSEGTLEPKPWDLPCKEYFSPPWPKFRLEDLLQRQNTRYELQDSERHFEDLTDTAFIWSLVVDLASLAVELSEAEFFKDVPLNIEEGWTNLSFFEVPSPGSADNTTDLCTLKGSMSNEDSSSDSSLTSEDEMRLKYVKAFTTALKRNLSQNRHRGKRHSKTLSPQVSSREQLVGIFKDENIPTSTSLDGELKTDFIAPPPPEFQDMSQQVDPQSESDSSSSEEEEKLYEREVEIRLKQAFDACLSQESSDDDNPIMQNILVEKSDKKNLGAPQKRTLSSSSSSGSDAESAQPVCTTRGDSENHFPLISASGHNITLSTIAPRTPVVSDSSLRDALLVGRYPVSSTPISRQEKRKIVSPVLVKNQWHGIADRPTVQNYNWLQPLTPVFGKKKISTTEDVICKEAHSRQIDNWPCHGGQPASRRQVQFIKNTRPLTKNRVEHAIEQPVFDSEIGPAELETKRNDGKLQNLRKMGKKKIVLDPTF